MGAGAQLEQHKQDNSAPDRQMHDHEGTCVARDALADIVIPLVPAGAVVFAGPGCTLVDIYLAAVPLEPRHTETFVLVHHVPADGPVLARAGGALVDVVLTMVPSEARRAEADIILSTLDAGPVI